MDFFWSDDCQAAFDRLKQLLIDSPLLVFPDFSRGFMMETDASGIGLGAVLAQEVEDGTLHPVAYASRTLQPHEQNYGATELEALGVVWATKHFRHYLYGHKCVIFTDHEALKSLLNTPHPSGKLARWGLILQDMELEIKYRSGKKNSNADALSRYPVSTPIEPLQDTSVTEVNGVVAALDSSREVESKDRESTLHDRQLAGGWLKIIIDYISDGVLPENDKEACQLILSSSKFTILDNILYHIESDKTLRVVVPETERKVLFDEVHAGMFGGHLRGAKIHSQLSRHYWWPKMRADIEKWCRSCLVCATRHLGHRVVPPLTPIPVGGPFGVDVVQLPRTRSGKQYAVVFVDYMTKWPEVFTTSNQSAFTIAKLLVEKIVSRHGVPSQLLSDRGGAFLSKLLQEIAALLGFHKVNTSAYHPQTDGLVERFNRTLIDMLAKTAKQNGWDEKLPFVLFAYRTAIQESTGESPFRLLYGRDPKLPTEDALSCPVDRTQVDLSNYKTEVSLNMAEAWKLAQERISKAQTHQKKQHDKLVKNSKFSEGDFVFLYDPSLKTGKAYKFAKPFRGPYKIVHLVKGGAEIQLVAKPKSKLICVAFNRLRHCPKEISDAIDEPEQVRSKEQFVGKEQITNDTFDEYGASVPDKQSTDISEPVDDSIIGVPSPTTDALADQLYGGDSAGRSINDEHKWRYRLRSRRKRCRRGRAP